jgi:hypothetical protein
VSDGNPLVKLQKDFVIPTLPKTGRRAVTQAQFETFVHSLLSGMSKHQAGKASGIQAQLVRRWVRQGRKDLEAGLRTAQGVFVQTVDMADAAVAGFLMQTMMGHALKDWRATEKILKNTHGWGNEPVVEDDAEDENPEKARRDRLRQSLPQYAAAPDIIDAVNDLEEVDES